MPEDRPRRDHRACLVYCVRYTFGFWAEELQEGKYIRLPYQKVTGENLSEIQKRERQMALP